MNFNNILSKVKNNKVLAIATIIAVPTVLVAGYYGYNYIRKKQEEKKEKENIIRMRKKYENIESVDDFIEGAKYVVMPNQFGYDFKYLGNKRDRLELLGIDKLKEFYENIKIPTDKKSNDENNMFLKYMHFIYDNKSLD